MKKVNTLVVNLFAGPSAGKSTFMGGIFWDLKWEGINVEMTQEYAKEVVWEGSLSKLDDQIYIFGKQNRRLVRLDNKLDVMVTDSPIILSTVYDELYKGNDYDRELRSLIMKEFKKYRNVNFFIQRNPDHYDERGRVQNLKQAMNVDAQILNYLDDHNIPYHTIPSKKENLGMIVDIIKKYLNEH